MLGGYQILDLREIDLTIGTSASNITDANVLKQLCELRNHIQKDYNFAKPLNNQLKPVLIRYRDKKNNEKHEVALYGNLEVLTNYYTFKINAIGHGEKLSIEVVFEEKTDEYENKYWDIKTAKVLLSIDEAIDGDASIGGDLSVTGDASIGGDLDLTGDAKIFENIVDAQGHKRFIEGDIDLSLDSTTGITKLYGKWALSGSHLLIVLCIKVNNGVELTNALHLANVNLPQWVINKIVPFTNAYVDRKPFTLVGSDWSTQEMQVSLGKPTTDRISITNRSTITLTADRETRIAFDLLIDNASE